MKNLLFKVLTIIAFSLIAGLSYSQCTPDPDCTDPEGDGEYCPTQFPNAIEDEYYDQVLTIIGPSEVQGVLIHHVDLISIGNIPPGMDYQCQDDNCSFWPGIAKCVSVHGTPAIDSWGTYHLHLTIEVFMDVNGYPVSLGQTTDSSSVVTIEPQLHGDFTVSNAAPNLICEQYPFIVEYVGNATENATYNWSFGDHISILSGEGQGPYELTYDGSGYTGLDSISLQVQEAPYTSPVFTNDYSVEVCTATDEVNNLDHFAVSPNPFSNHLMVYADEAGASKISIYGVDGKVVYQDYVSGNENMIDLSPLKKGVYLVRMTNTKFTKTVKIIKK